MNWIIYIGTALLILTGAAPADSYPMTAKTEDGRQVMLQEDGSWTFVEENDQQKMLGKMQTGYLEGYPGATTGESFARFFDQPKWHFEEDPDSMKQTVVFTGRLQREGLFETKVGSKQTFAAKAPVKIEFALTGTKTFDVTYAEIGVKVKERWVPREVKVDLLLARINEVALSPAP